MHRSQIRQIPAARTFWPTPAGHAVDKIGEMPQHQQGADPPAASFRALSCPPRGLRANGFAGTMAQPAADETDATNRTDFGDGGPLDDACGGGGGSGKLPQ